MNFANSKCLKANFVDEMYRIDGFGCLKISKGKKSEK